MCEICRFEFEIEIELVSKLSERTLKEMESSNLMLASWAKVKTVQELVDEAFWMRQGLIRFLSAGLPATLTPAAPLKEPVSQVIGLLMEFQDRSASVLCSKNPNEEVEGQNQLGATMLAEVRAALNYSGIDVDRLAAECKAVNQVATEGPEPGPGQKQWASTLLPDDFFDEDVVEDETTIDPWD